MKKTLFFALLLMMLFSVNIFADVTFGAFAGINTGWYSGNDWDDFVDYYESVYGNASGKARFGFTLAAFLDLGINENFSIQPELQFTTFKGGLEVTDSVGDTIETYETNNSLVIPVLAKIKFNTGKGKFSLFGGPELIMVIGDVQTKTRVTISGSSGTSKSDYELDNTTGMGFTIGAGYELPLGSSKFITDFRYSRSLFDTLDNDDTRFNSIGLNIGYGFIL